MNTPNILAYRNKSPEIAKDAFIAPGASLIGDVKVGAGSSVWFSVTMRGDVMPIRIGERTSIQDNSVVHATGGWTETSVGDDCVVGHTVILHGCRLGNRVLVGMGAIILDGADIGDDVLIGAGTLITARTKIPPRSLVLGRPGKVKRELTDDELMSIKMGALTYEHKTKEYLEAFDYR